MPQRQTRTEAALRRVIRAEWMPSSGMYDVTLECSHTRITSAGFLCPQMLCTECMVEMMRPYEQAPLIRPAKGPS